MSYHHVWLDFRRPLTGKRGHVAEHLYKAGPKSSNSRLDALKGSLTHGAKKGLKYAVGGAVFYFAVSLALGGRDRVKHDLEVLKVRRQEVSPQDFCGHLCCVSEVRV